MLLSTFLIIIAAHFFLSLLMHSFYLHRYSTHGQFTMNLFWERFFFILTWLLQGPSFLNPTAYAKMHLAHHEFSDTTGDPHSPLNFSKSKWGLDFPVALSKMMWSTNIIFMEIRRGTHAIAQMYRDRTFPTWGHFEAFTNTKVSMLLLGTLYVLFYIFFAPVWWVWIFLPITILNGPAQGAIVNWCGHMWGYRRYKLDDNSRNTPVLNIVMLGELNQNNHHKDPNNPNFAKAWYEIDIIYPIIIVFSWFHILKLRPKA